MERDDVKNLVQEREKFGKLKRAKYVYTLKISKTNINNSLFCCTSYEYSKLSSGDVLLYRWQKIPRVEVVGNTQKYLSIASS